MTPKEFIRAIRALGWYLDDHGRRHDIYRHPEQPGVKLEVERHNKDIAAGTLHELKKRAGLK